MARRMQQRVLPVQVKSGSAHVRTQADHRVPVPAGFCGRLLEVRWTDAEGTEQIRRDDGSFFYLIHRGFLHLAFPIPGGTLVYLTWGEPA